MKIKNLMTITLSLLIGSLCGKAIFNQYKSNIEEVVLETKPIYLLQQGVYSSVESMEDNTVALSDYMYIKQDDKYYVYLGVTSDKEIANKLKNNYKNIDIYVKENNTSNTSLLEKIKQNDESIKIEENNNNLLSFSKKSLEIYEESMNTAENY